MFYALDGNILSDHDHTIKLDNGHVLTKSDLAFKTKQLMAPNKFASRSNTPVNADDLAGKRTIHFSARRLDSNNAGPSSSRRFLGTSAAKRQKSITFTSKGSLSFDSEPTSTPNLDHA